MKLERWALIAEIAGASAIVLSLVFVGTEIRRNTNAAYATAYENLLSEQIDWRMDLATNPPLLESWSDVINYELQPADFVAQASMLMYEKAFIFRRYGMLNDQEWSRYERTSCDNWTKERLSNPAIERFFSSDFVEFVLQCEYAQ